MKTETIKRGLQLLKIKQLEIKLRSLKAYHAIKNKHNDRITRAKCNTIRNNKSLNKKLDEKLKQLNSKTSLVKSILHTRIEQTNKLVSEKLENNLQSSSYHKRVAIKTDKEVIYHRLLIAEDTHKYKHETDNKMPIYHASIPTYKGILSFMSINNGITHKSTKVVKNKQVRLVTDIKDIIKENDNFKLDDNIATTPFFTEKLIMCELSNSHEFEPFHAQTVKSNLVFVGDELISVKIKNITKVKSEHYSHNTKTVNYSKLSISFYDRYYNELSNIRFNANRKITNKVTTTIKARKNIEDIKAERMANHVIEIAGKKIAKRAKRVRRR